MNVSLKNNDAVSATLKIEVELGDYAEQLDKNLRNLRRKAKMPGFRTGMVPLGMIKKLYEKQALAEEINKLVSEKLYSYIQENDIRILGEPIPSITEQKTIDFEKDESFEFCFDLALSPEVDIQLTKDDCLTAYRILVDDEMVNKQIDSYRKSFATYQEADTVEINDIVKGSLAEWEKGAPKADGIVNKEAVLLSSYLKGKREQNKFIGAKLGDHIVFNPFKAFGGAEAEIASFLNIDKEQAKEMKSDFSFEVTNISRSKEAELNQEFFDRVFGGEQVKTEAEFRDKFKESIANQCAPQTDNKFRNDVRALLVSKAENIGFADEILKRWLLVSNEKTTKEDIDNDFPKAKRDLKYHLIKEKFAKEFDIKIENQEIEEMAKFNVRLQFMQYGGYSVPDEMVENYAKDMLKKQEVVNNIVDRLIEEKLIVRFKEMITINEQEITIEEFDKILQNEREVK